MKRRELMLIPGGAMTAPGALRAQQKAMLGLTVPPSILARADEVIE